VGLSVSANTPIFCSAGAGTGDTDVSVSGVGFPGAGVFSPGAESIRPKIPPPLIFPHVGGLSPHTPPIFDSPLEMLDVGASGRAGGGTSVSFEGMFASLFSHSWRVFISPLLDDGRLRVAESTS
jgi:hypothetical protein